MRLPRFRLRTLLIAVAIAGLACGGGDMMRRYSAYYQKLAAFHRQQAEEYASQFFSGLRGRFPTDAQLESARPRYRYYQALAAKYERAARHPWLPVPPDPPMPE